MNKHLLFALCVGTFFISCISTTPNSITKGKRYFPSISDEWVYESFWYSQMDSYSSNYITEDSNFIYYLTTSSELDSFANIIIKSNNLMVLQKKKCISSDLKAIYIKLMSLEKQNSIPFSKAILIQLETKEWFFLSDTFDIKINGNICNIKGKSDSKMGKGANMLTTTLLCELDEAAFNSLKEISPTQSLPLRIYTKKGYIDLELPLEYVSLIKHGILK
jgi:hypothetical protein